jgi:hypothetical protein
VLRGLEPGSASGGYEASNEQLQNESGQNRESSLRCEKRRRSGRAVIYGIQSNSNGGGGGVGILTGIENTKLLNFRDAINAENSEIAANWTVSETRGLSFFSAQKLGKVEAMFRVAHRARLNPRGRSSYHRQLS